MLAQVVLAPAESKKLISKAVAALDVVRQAATEGIVALHPSSSTYFIVEEITGEKPNTDYWVCGIVTQRGMCVEKAMALGDGYTPEKVSSDPRDLRACWIIKNKKLQPEEKLSDLLSRMTHKDVYIKGVNAMDSQGNVGVLFGFAKSIGYILSAWKRKQFNLIYPVGLEKLIPTPIDQATRAAKIAQYSYGMGMPTGLFPWPRGKTINELDAVEILSGAEAIPIASGGLRGAEGAITLVINGNDDQVMKAIEYVEQSKGARFPPVHLCSCDECPVPHCRFPVGDKPWTVS